MAQPSVKLPKGAVPLPDGAIPLPQGATPYTGNAQQPPPEPSLGDKLSHEWDVVTGEAPYTPAGPFDEFASHFVRSIGGAIRHPIRSLASMPLGVPAITNESRGKGTILDQLNARNNIDAAKHLTSESVPAALGDVGAMVAVAHALPVVTGAAADVMGRTGEALQSGGAKASNFGLGTQPTDMELDTNPGRALSRQRIVGARRPALLQQVKGQVEPLAQGRNTILSQSQAPPTNITQEVNQPFNDITATKTHPRTGAVQPAQQARLVQSQRAINEIQDPSTGMPSGTPKDLTQHMPLEISDLNRNVYDMANYENPDASLSNQALKETGANLRDVLNRVAPEATDITDLLHDTLGARDLLTRQVKGEPGMPADKAGLVMSALRAGRLGAGTALGAAMDVAGSGLRTAAGAVRSSLNPPATPQSGSTNTPPPPRPPAQNMGWATPANPIPGGPGITPGPVGPPQLPAPGQTGLAPTGVPLSPPSVSLPTGPPELPMPTRQLGLQAGMQQAGLPAPGETSTAPGYVPRTPPPLNADTARMRVQPTEFAQPGSTASPSQINVTPEGQGQPITTRALPAKTAPGKRIGTLMKQILSGGKPALTQSGPAETIQPPASENQSTSVDKSGGATPMGTAAPKASTPSGNLVQKVTGEALKENAQALGPEMGGGPKKTLAAQVETTPAVTKPNPKGIPGPRDIDAWEALVDEGRARYNTQTHQYDYIPEQRNAGSKEQAEGALAGGGMSRRNFLKGAGKAAIGAAAGKTLLSKLAGPEGDEVTAPIEEAAQTAANQIYQWHPPANTLAEAAQRGLISIRQWAAPLLEQFWPDTEDIHWDIDQAQTPEEYVDTLLHGIEGEASMGGPLPPNVRQQINELGEFLANQGIQKGYSYMNPSGGIKR